MTVNPPGLAFIDFMLQQSLQQPVCGPALKVRLRAQVTGQPFDGGQAQVREHHPQAG
jgi:hypothetical protein